MKDPYTGRTRVVTVAAVAPADYFIANGVFYGLAGARSHFGYPIAFDRLYLALRDGVDADAFAADVQARFIRHGAEAVSISAIMDEGFTQTRQIFQLFQGYLAMGLIVGIAGMAVVMVRAVRERRRQIGTLRALGFGARPIGRSFAVETAFVAVEGTVIGAALALVTLYDIVALSDSFGDLPFSVPVVAARPAPRRHGRGVAARDRLPGDLRQPDSAGGGAADDRLTEHGSLTRSSPQGGSGTAPMPSSRRQATWWRYGQRARRGVAKGDTMNRFLIATDGSPAAEAAVEAGVQLAQEQGAGVVFLRVVEAIEVVAPPFGPIVANPSCSGRPRTTRCSLVPPRQPRGTRCRSCCRLVAGFEVETILAEADAIDAELIAIGSNRHGLLGTAYFGSVSKELLRRARRPILVVHPTPTLVGATA